MKTEKESSELFTSFSNPTHGKLICNLCNTNKPLSDLLFIKTCHHSFCSRCVAQYVSELVLHNAAAISCPVTRCKTGIFEPVLCRPMIEREVFDHWCLSLCVSVIEKKVNCPFRDCCALLADERGDREVVREAVCPHCRRMFRP
ncbi:probable E3 ubiquitin-protein ligase RNF144A-B [Phalaenopsis equestris]|uniref:probable E3 ubiquitin-protein ligase RNF144A-B n=1 Tax=Phalaenopsis equestris TaxID=78828 RepID=UPI0009E52B0C|nr:probable E3 ubiquitin-protein ligase RNF144A-B [Phalaenopsis equestris]